LVNPVINGGFDIAQRGTSVSIGASANGYTLDRWFVGTGANQAMTMSQQATGDTTNLPNIQYCARVQRNSGQTGAGATGFDGSLETINSIPYAGKTVTVSFYARAGANYSPTSSLLNLQLLSGTGTNQNVSLAGYTGSSTLINQNATLTTTWQRFAWTGTVPTNATELAIRFIATWAGTAGAADYYEVTGVQIDLGTYVAATAPTFRRAGGTIQGELAACQRYYQFLGGAASNFIVAGYTAVSSSYRQFISFPVQMRIAPTMAVNGTWAVLNTSQPTAAFISNAGFAFTMQATATGQLFSYPDSSDDTITASAEL
jgi:hypothetical protein